MNKQEEQDIQFQIECLTNELVIMLMDDYGMSMEQALDTVYDSNTYKKIESVLSRGCLCIGHTKRRIGKDLINYDSQADL